MISQNSDELVANATTVAERGCYAQQKSKHVMSGRLATFIWQHESRDINSRQECKREDANDIVKTQMEHRFKTASTSSKTFGFFRNIKRYLQIKNLCRSKQKSKEAGTLSSCQRTNQDAIRLVDKDAVIPVIGPDYCQEHSIRQQESLSNRLSLYGNKLGNMLENSCRTTEENVDNSIMQHSNVTGMYLNIVPTWQQDESTRDIAVANDAIMQSNYSNATAEVPSAITGVTCGTNETLTNENKAKASLAEELLNLSKYGWYWGPISVDQADAKLISEPDGAFLVRDSSDDRYVLTLSFKSSGKMLHARMEHSGGLFSLCNQRENEGFTSVAALINHSMNFSQSAVFCYSRPRYPGYPSFPVRLTKPVSRFTQVKSLQYLCRFVIRQNTSLDNIHKLPLPETIKLYILEAHY